MSKLHVKFILPHHSPFARNYMCCTLSIAIGPSSYLLICRCQPTMMPQQQASGNGTSPSSMSSRWWQRMSGAALGRKSTPTPRIVAFVNSLVSGSMLPSSLAPSSLNTTFFLRQRPSPTSFGPCTSSPATCCRRKDAPKLQATTVPSTQRRGASTSGPWSKPLPICSGEFNCFACLTIANTIWTHLHFPDHIWEHRKFNPLHDTDISMFIWCSADHYVERSRNGRKMPWYLIYSVVYHWKALFELFLMI